ncbi:MAG: hypothetical protein II721_01615 [Bacilli bacterium]|nr:hypothetical protein [Bacilli bacterium]
MANYADRKTALHQKSERYLRTYQKLSIYMLIPFCLDFFAVVLGTIIGSFHLYFSLGTTRYFLEVFTNINNVYLILLPSGLFLALYFALALLSAKGKLYAVIFGTALYVADFVLLIVHLITHIEGADVATYAISIVIHSLFLVLFAILILYYIKATLALKEEARA